MSRYNKLNVDDIFAILCEEDNITADDSASEEEGEENCLQNVENNNENSCDSEDTQVNSCTEEDIDAADVSVTFSSERIHHISDKIIRGKNGHIWSTSRATLSHRTKAMNIVRASRGPASACKNIFDPTHIFNLFITDEILNEIVKWTNVEMITKRQNISKTTATYKDTQYLEIRAFIGILTLTAVMKDNHLSTDELFDSTFSGTRYVSVMSKERFEFLSRCLRMDDKALRPMLRPNDAFVPARNVWEMFIKQCRNNYIPGSEVTIDEQLLGFRGRCPFRIYIPNKPSKYGIKFPMMCDATSKYMIDADPYTGRTTNSGGIPLGEFYVKKLSKTIHGSNRSITCDNWFTSVPLAKNLLQPPYKLTIVGTIRSNKREIPEKLKNSRSRSAGTSMFCFDGPLTLVSYKPKPSKMVYLLSSCDEDAIINHSSRKPDMIHFYNQTKGGVDSFDQMCSSMSCSRKTNRWPMAVFYGILNMSFVNSAIIYSHNMAANNQKPLNRREYMKQLSTDLMKPWMEERLQGPTLIRSVRDNIGTILGDHTSTHDNSQSEESEPKKRKYCCFCSYKKRGCQK
ncbi:piggyBac transposable element-derived protein 4-like [Eurosta solidaginis]|uniref:piggyBac transposable element-derived protein 4-like n=1 Tax=Eurosta solidaginis TaxID=178769 RepID=UPI003530EC4E